MLKICNRIFIVLPQSSHLANAINYIYALTLISCVHIKYKLIKMKKYIFFDKNCTFFTLLDAGHN